MSMFVCSTTLRSYALYNIFFVLLSLYPFDPHQFFTDVLSGIHQQQHSFLKIVKLFSFFLNVYNLSPVK